jgi:hypothetical protein
MTALLIESLSFSSPAALTESLWKSNFEAVACSRNSWVFSSSGRFSKVGGMSSILRS